MDRICKILVVDDEWAIRDGIASYAWEELGCKVVGKAENGEEALLMVKGIRPDIIISDIKMPEMDGITFIEKAKEIHPAAEAILLTGYDDFAFARSAIRLGVTDYLLKPTDFEELKRVVEKLCRKIRQNEARQAYYRKMQECYERSMPVLSHKVAQDLLGGKLCGREEISRQLSLLNIQLSEFLVVSAFLDCGEEQLKEAGMHQRLLEFGVTNICEEIFKKSCENVLTDSEPYQYRFILGYSSFCDDSTCITLCMQACERIQREIRNYIGQEISFGISQVSRDPGQLQLCCKQAIEACRRKAFFEKACIICYRDVSQEEKTPWRIESLQQQLINGILAGCENEVSQVMRALSEELERQQPDIEQVKAAMMELMLYCLKNTELVQPAQELLSLRENMERVNGSATLRELCDIVKAFLLKLTLRHGEEPADFHRKTVEKIVLYIEEHYREDLFLDSVSEKFNLSGAYISRLIKKYTGKSFLEILVDVRIGKARELIASRQYKIYEIAELVGYNDNSYFIQVFKKKTGKTPKEYAHSLA